MVVELPTLGREDDGSEISGLSGKGNNNVVKHIIDSMVVLMHS